MQHIELIQVNNLPLFNGIKPKSLRFYSAPLLFDFRAVVAMFVVVVHTPEPRCVHLMATCFVVVSCAAATEFN